MSAFAKLKAIDFYRRIPRDLTEASLTGAGLSIVAAVVMVFLFGMEFANFLSVTTTTTVVVDQSQNGDLLRINFNFSFPSLSCEFASVDVTDVLGTARYNLTKTIRKYPINQALQVVGPEHHPDPVPTPKKKGNEEEEDHAAVETLKSETGVQTHIEGSLVLTDATFDHFSHAYSVLVVNFFAPWCPWCQRLEPAWEAASTIMNNKYHPDYDHRIRIAKVDCTIYQDLCQQHHIQGFPSIRIFRKGGDMREHQGAGHDHESYYGDRDTNALVKFMDSLVTTAELGLEPTHTEVRRRAPQASGCHIEGFLLVKKVPGNVMVSANSGAHSFDAATMNMTHLVTSFSFGRPLTRRRQDEVDRLLPHLPTVKDRIEDHHFVLLRDNMTIEHFIQVVKTEVVPAYSRSRSHGNPLVSYEYTAHSNSFQTLNVPVARFHYEPSPMQVLISENKRSFSHFLTNMCAIIGGVFTVAGILDGMFHGALRMIKKVDLGKQY